MVDYQKMYLALFNAATDAIRLLQEAQQSAEEIYLSGSDAEIRFDGPTEENDEGGDQ